MNEYDKKLSVYKPDLDTSPRIPFAESGVHAGFPSPAEDFLEGTLDLNRLVIKHPEATFFARVEGDSMCGEGIDDGDILVVDKAAEPFDGCLAVAYVDGEFTLKRVRIGRDAVELVAANPKYKNIRITPDNDFTVWGVVRWILKSV